MKEMARYGLTLSIICAISAAALSSVNLLTRSRIIQQAQAAEDAALKDVLPDSARFEPVEKDGEVLYYKAFDSDGNFSDVAFVARQKGYSSEIVTMAGMDRQGVIRAVKVLSQNETPGLGTAVASGDFTGQFAGAPAADLSGVSAITGATISSKAVIDSVKAKAGAIKGLLSDER